MSFERKFYAFIRAYHRTRGISIPAFGRLIGKSERQTYRIINMETKISIKDMEQIMAKLGYGLDFSPIAKDGRDGLDGRDVGERT
jgi:hypothetical protein